MCSSPLFQEGALSPLTQPRRVLKSLISCYLKLRKTQLLAVPKIIVIVYNQKGNFQLVSIVIYNVFLHFTFYLTLSSPQLVGGEFDLEVNFIIQDSEGIICMLELLEQCEITCQAEIWSMFTALLRKSVRNLQTCTEVGLIQRLLLKMSSADDMIAGTSVLHLTSFRCYN